MSANYAVICGEKLKKPLTKQITHHTNGAYIFDEKTTFTSVQLFRENVENSLGNDFSKIKGLLLLDYGFEVIEPHVMVEEFILLQETLKTHKLEKLNIKFITNNKKLFEIIKKGYKGHDTILLDNIEVYYQKEPVKIMDIVIVLTGVSPMESITKNSHYDSKTSVEAMLGMLQNKLEGTEENPEIPIEPATEENDHTSPNKTETQATEKEYKTMKEHKLLNLYQNEDYLKLLGKRESLKKIIQSLEEEIEDVEKEIKKLEE